MSDKDEIIAAIREGFSNVGGISGGSRGYVNTQGGFADGLKSSKVLREFGTAIGLATNPMLLTGVLMGGLVDSLKGGIGAWQEAAQTGLYFSKNFIGYNLELDRAQLQQRDINQIYRTTGATFATLGGTLEYSTKNFFALNRSFQQSGVANQLDDLGFNTAQQNELLAISATGITDYARRLKAGENVQKQATDAALNLAIGMAASTDMLGISRQKMMDMFKDIADDESIQVAFDQIGQDSQQVYKDVAVGLPPTLERLTREAFTQRGAIVDEKNAQLASLFGPVGQQVIQASANLRRTLESGAKGDELAAAQAEFAKARQAAINYTQQEQFQNNVQVSRAMGENKDNLIAMSKDFRVAREVDKAARESGITYEEAYKRRQDELKKQGKELGDDQEKNIASLSKSVLEAQQIYNQKAAIAADTLTILANSLGKLTKAPLPGGGTFEESLRQRNTKGELNIFNAVNAEEKTAQFATDLINFSSNLLPESAVKAFSSFAEYGAKFGSLAAEKIGDYIKKFSPGADAPSRSAGSPGIADFLNSGGGNISSIFENFGSGTLATLHGMESVIRPEQLNRIVNKAAGQAMNQLGNMQGLGANTAGQFAQVNPEVFNDIRSQLAALNSIMASHLPDISSSMTKQYSALRDLSPDFHA